MHRTLAAATLLLVTAAGDASPAVEGSRIIMGTLLAVVNTVDFGLDPARAIDAERIDEQSGTKMTIEQGRVTSQAGLLARGHTFEREYAELPRVQAAGVDPETGERLAADEPPLGETLKPGNRVTTSSAAAGVSHPMKEDAGYARGFGATIRRTRTVPFGGGE